MRSSLARLILSLSVGLFFTFVVSSLKAHDVEKVTYAGSPGISVPVLVAIDRGYFAEEGLDVEYQLLQTGKLAMEAVMSGRADFGSVVITNVAYAGFQTEDLRLLASYGAMYDDAVVFRLPSTIHEVKDLKDKKIGLVMSTSSQDFLIHLLDKNGLSWADIKTVSLQPATMLAALKGNQVDAVVTWEPWRSGIRRAMNGAIGEIVNNANIYHRHSFCASTSGYLAKHPDVPPKLLRALLKAEGFMDTHQNETFDIVAKVTGQKREDVQTYVAPVHIYMGHDILPLIKSYAAWITQHQEDFFNKTMPNYSWNIDSTFLKAVAPQRVEKRM